MLKELSITDFGLIDSLTISFGKGLNVFTGETGAGKSIIIGALRLALGARMNMSNIRDGADCCNVEAVYDLSGSPLGNHELLRDFLDADASLIIRRSVSADQKNKIKVNGKTLTVAELKSIGDLLTDLHGPHDHQLLLNEEMHIGFLDDLTDFAGSDKKFSEEFARYKSLSSALASLKTSARNREQELDVLSFQIKELSQVPLDPTEHDALISEQKRIQNTESLYQLCSTLCAALDDDEISVTRILRDAHSASGQIARIDDSAESIAQDMTDIQERVNDLTSKVISYRESLSYDDERAKTVNDICDHYAGLKRKYGATIEELISFSATAQERYRILSHYAEDSAQLEKDTFAAKDLCMTLAEKMHVARAKTAKTLQIAIEKELQDLGIKSVIFKVSIEKSELSPRGIDIVRFFISTNAGETLKPLADIVSSGEAARVMLALKMTLATVDPVPVLVFDEIDAQIGGRLGTVIGEKLTELAALRQVILITHLPQIAAFGNAHFKITKSEIKGRTVTNAVVLDKKNRIAELAHMLCGKDNDPISLRHAEEMLSQSAR